MIPRTDKHLANQEEAFSAALQALKEKGLNWIAYVPADKGPAPFRPDAFQPQYGLLFFLSMGPSFGKQLTLSDQPDSHPFDTQSEQLATSFKTKWLSPGEGTCVIYPPNSPVDIRSWLEAGRIQFRSPIGIGIRPDCGPWLGVRAIISTALSPWQLRVLEKLYPPLTSSSFPCDNCKDTPCVKSCPGKAVSASGVKAKELDACLTHRLEKDSSCAERCQSRLACPIGTEYRYTPEVMRYHYGRSLYTIRKWKEWSKEEQRP